MSRESSLTSSFSSSSSRVRGGSAVRSSSTSGSGRRALIETTILPDGTTTTTTSSSSTSSSTGGARGGASSAAAGAITPIPITIDSRHREETKEELVERFSSSIVNGVNKLKRGGDLHDQRRALQDMAAAMQHAWSSRGGRDVATRVSDALRESGGLDVLVAKVEDNGASTELRVESAEVLERAMTAENRDHIVNASKLKSVVKFSIGQLDHLRDDNRDGNRPMIRPKVNNVKVTRVGTGILGQLFKHSEDTCQAVLKEGGLDAILRNCQALDKDVLRFCAIAFANLAMYGGEESQQMMVKKNVPAWLFHLAFSDDEVTRYYACLAICSLVANKEFEAAVAKSGTLTLVEPFIESHDPADFAVADAGQIHGQSEGWLKRLLPVLESTNAEAQSLSAFHFCMETCIKGAEDDVLRRIGAVEALARVASCPNDTASKLAARALRTLGEEVPHRLPQQVQLWRSSDVNYWVKNVIDFPDHAKAFSDCKVDGDLLLQMNDSQLREDVGMKNGLLRRRFLRHLDKLKTTSDYSSCDHSKIDDWLMRIGAQMTRYTYNFNRVGVTRSELLWLTDDQLKQDIGITNGIHRKMILQAVEEDKQQEMAMFGRAMASDNGDLEVESGGDCAKSATTGLTTTTTTTMAVPKFNKTVDVFISYRRSNGSQLASLLKVHLQLRNFVVFIDIEKLEAGKFDENLLNSVRAAKHFLLILTPNALDRCVDDDDQNDWVHKEITTALNSGCNIIPITNDFEWPQPETLPEDMRKICSYNGVKWIHDYQDACIAKVIRFIKGEPAAPSTVHSRGVSGVAGVSGAAGSAGAGLRSAQTSFASGSDYQAGLKDTEKKWNSLDMDLNDDSPPPGEDHELDH